ncbi:hypothetical protein GGR57DRAFT_327873 [Xylariaceae sp. FL1272]|nr:hypothetical protein GGR57DRAFT_327873 [Xylariaceae sp. FL1272]
MTTDTDVTTGGLEALPTRPPTPPRERQAPADQDPNKLTLSRNPLTTRLTLQTPPNYSPDSALSTNQSSRRTRKKVEFTVQAEYREPPSYATTTSASFAGKENAHRQSTPISAPSSVGLERPLKSILKPTSSPNPPNPLDPSSGQDEAGRTASLAVMLESAIKQLAGNDRDNKIDAYDLLVRALKTSNNLPDRIALQDKMTLFTQFIQRDITTKAANGTTDWSVVNHAIILLSTFLHFQAIASSISPDFGVFIIDHCIRSFEDPATPKEHARYLMQIVAAQNFPAKVMSADRVGRLVAALHNIENHLKGKSIVVGRILVYRRLLRQCRAHMVTHSDWLLDLFTDMLSSMKETRANAISLGLEASFSVAKEKQLTKKVTDILQMTVDETRYVEYYAKQLTAMTKDREVISAVPQVWSVVVLLLRCPIDKWEFFDQWLEIIQKCFNSADRDTKVEANLAWNRLVYALHLHESSFNKTVGMLCQPFTSQLKRSRKVFPPELRKIAIGSLCNLYYYAFAPTANPNFVELYWDTCVKSLIKTLVFPENDGKAGERQKTPSADLVAHATNILSALFNQTSMQRLWKEDRISENALAKPEDLPALDPKWIRRNGHRVFSVVEPILGRTFLDLADSTSDASRLWRSLVGSVAAAASKEVKVSVDTAAFLGHGLGLFMKIWSGGCLGEAAAASVEQQQTFLAAVQSYLTTVISSLGHLPFTEKLLTMDKQQNTLIPLATPSHRSSKSHTSLTRSPLHHLFAILTVLPPGLADSEGLLNLIRTVFEPFVPTRSPRARREFALELMQISSAQGPAPYGVWAFVADTLSTSMDHSQSSTSSTDSTYHPQIGHELRDMVKHLEKGISNTPELPWDLWLSFYEFVVGQAIELSGEAGCSLGVVEALSKALVDNFPADQAADTVPVSPPLLRCCACLMSTAKHPRDRAALDAARRRLWGTSMAGAKSASFDPFDKFYELMGRSLKMAYLNVQALDDTVTSSLLEQTTQFLSRCNPLLVFKSLVQLQHGLGPWIQDADGQYGNKQHPSVAEAVMALWDRICTLFADAAIQDFQLDVIEQLLCCAFKSKHRHTVNSAVTLWNRGFEHAEEIEYPETLREVLLSVRAYADIVLPGLDVSSFDSHSAAQPMFIDSQDDIDIPTNLSSYRLTPRFTRPPSSRASASGTPASDRSLSSSSRQKSESARLRSQTKSSRRNKTAKLRHDDSQIQFAPIEQPSPSENLVDESQVLTDRQKEVRDRQQENAALFPAMRSSPEKATTRSSHGSRQPSPLQPRAAEPIVDEEATTPRVNRSYEYVSSTPTPRRGQAAIVDEDHEMTDDIPSSPPEPRRNLLPEMKSHSRSNSVLAEMPVSSSPISGSPVTRSSQRLRELKASSQGGSADPVSPSKLRQQLAEQAGSVPDAVPDSSQLPMITLTHEPSQEQSLELPAIDPTTPPKLNPPTKNQETPRSDNDVFVDALASPARRQTRSSVSVPSSYTKGREEDMPHHGDRSFEMSDGEERSMARLVIELDSRKCDPTPNYDSSPEKQRQKAEAALDSITVHIDDGDGELPLPPAKEPSPPVIPSTQAEPSDSQSPGVNKSKRKRKRGSEKRQSSGKKRRQQQQQQQQSIAEVEEVSSSAVEDSQVAAAAAEVVSSQPQEPVAANHSFPSPDLAHQADDSFEPLSMASPSDQSIDGDNAAVYRQLITEASQQSEHNLTEAIPESFIMDEEEPTEDDQEMAGADDAVPSSVPAPPTAEPSALEKIMASLRDGLSGLRTATLSRDEVYKIEDMFMDIKRELYEAESRSRRLS